MQFDWNQLKVDMLDTGKFDVERLQQPDILPKLYDAHRSVIRDRNGHIYAHLARIPTRGTRYDLRSEELAMAYVHEDDSRNGLLGELLDQLLSEAKPADHFRYFGFSRDPAVIKVFDRRGLHLTTAVTCPHLVSWAQWLGVRHRLPDTAFLEKEPDFGKVIEECKNPKTARRWLLKQ